METDLVPLEDVVAVVVEALAVVAAAAAWGLLELRSWHLGQHSRIHFATFFEEAVIAQWQQPHQEEREAFGLDDAVDGLGAAADGPEVLFGPFHFEEEMSDIVGDESFFRAVDVACDAYCSFHIGHHLAWGAEQDIFR